MPYELGIKQYLEVTNYSIYTRNALMKQFHKTRNLFKYSLTFSALATCISVATAAPITLVNQGFETGDLTGWSTVGTVVAAGQTNVTTNNGTNYLISPNDTTMAFLDSFGASISDIESFFGLSSGTFVTAVGPVFSESGGEEGGGRCRGRGRRTYGYGSH
jgi:hypothetical protein